MATHAAVATVGLKQHLAIIQVPTIKPQADEVRVHVEWTASTPLDLHQNDGGLLVKPPQVLGDGTAGTVIEVGPGVKRLKVGDKVFGFTWREQKEKAHQEFCTAPEWLLGLLPKGFTLAEAVTLPNNFVTVFHALTADLNIELPWPKPVNYIPRGADEGVLIWGGSSSVGQFAIQILKYYGYTKILTTASKRHHEKLRSFGAEFTFDYRDLHVVDDILNAERVSLVLDCIGSFQGSIKKIARIAKSESRVAILLPVIVRDSNEDVGPIYEMDVKKGVDWENGIDVRGVRTHSYLDHNEFFKYHLQADIMPTMLKERIVEPNNQKIIEGKTMLVRAQEAMNVLRRKGASGERLVWRVSDM
ncbi:GroES-like protein [Lojkania enalia]|uniref:GroES-like protein n=1 Tax=Lojkania enalia TaxID=147567 RepID=A0A9P4KHJ1_9PLEO|nr:GroES-like protein [Didymosphaeria enalia]